MNNPAPTSEEQLAFLGNIERLLLEGQFVATYKYALLIALADLAVRRGRDDGSELDVPLNDIAERFIELYWRQSAPYGSSVGDAGVLRQNTGGQAAVIRAVDELRKSGLSIGDVRRSRAWSSAVSTVTRNVQDNPLWRLQRLRSGNLEFLYGHEIHDGCIRLKAGVGANLRRFHGFIIRMAESEWLRFVQSLPANSYLLGRTTDLEQFLFGSDRTRLQGMVPSLLDLQHGECLYCHRAISTAEVDHFIPWARYPADLAHNLVLAHRACNQSKKDLMAAETHLEYWLLRNERHSLALAEAGRNAGVLVDPGRTSSIAEWAYSRASISGAAVWLEKDVTGALDGRWRTLLAKQHCALPADL